MIKLIALDMDETLLSKHKSISQRNKQILEKVADMGIHIVGASGRPITAMPQDFLDLKGTRYIITSNGAAIWDRKEKKYLRLSFLSREQAILLIHALDKITYKGLWGEICVNGQSYAPKEQFDNINSCTSTDIAKEYLMETRLPVDNIFDFVLTCDDTIERVSFFCENTEILDTIKDHIKFIPDINIAQALSQDLEIGHKETSKGKALKFLTEYLELKKDEVMAIGDGMNDYDMIDYAGIGVAMKNGNPALFDIANYITDHNEHDGVAKAIEKYVIR